MADVALFYGERSGGIRTYVDAKAAWARATGAIEHHVIVPAPAAPRADGGAVNRHELPSLRLAATNGYRVPIGVGALRATLRALRPDVVLLHDPFWGPLRVARTAHELGATRRRGPPRLDRARRRRPAGARSRSGIRCCARWMHHAYREADAVISAVDPRADCGRAAAIALRFGLDPAFVPQPDVAREDHVLYVGRLGREKGVVELLHAAARSREPWRLRLHGRGPIELRAAAARREPRPRRPRAVAALHRRPRASSRARTRPRASSSCRARTRRSASSASRRRRAARAS